MQMSIIAVKRDKWAHDSMSLSQPNCASWIEKHLHVRGETAIENIQGKMKWAQINQTRSFKFRMDGLKSVKIEK